VKQPTLYLMMGLPGAGKTTASIQIAKLTGAEHLWADKIRRDKFGKPSYTHDENQKLYFEMNSEVDKLLAEGKSVVFDTNFKYQKDRQHLSEIAKKHAANVVICWLKVDRELAKQRALEDTDHPHRPLGADMTENEFERLSADFEHPDANERVIELDGTKITPDYVAEKLQLNEAN
jgi:predicted kinase